MIKKGDLLKGPNGSIGVVWAFAKSRNDNEGTIGYTPPDMMRVHVQIIKGGGKGYIKEGDRLIWDAKK